MSALDATSPAQFIADFYTRFTEEVVHSDDPGAAMHRFYTPDVVQYSNGIRMDWDKLLAHTRPVRRNFPEGRIEVHQAVADGDRIAAWMTFHAVSRQGRAVTTEAQMFAEFTPDGRMRRAHGLSRTVPEAE